MKIIRWLIYVSGCILLATGGYLLYLRSHPPASSESEPVSVRIRRSSGSRGKQTDTSLETQRVAPAESESSEKDLKPERDALPPTPPALSLNIITAKLSMGAVGIDYRHFIKAAGVTGKAIWNISSGKLPPGLKIGLGGIIDGIPEEAGEWSFTIQVQDEKGKVGQKNFRLLIRPALPDEEADLLSIVTGSIAQGFLGREYLQKIEGSGGETPYRWAQMGGVLPDLIHLNKQSGVLYGSPREVGKFPFTLRLTDSEEKFVEKNFVLEVKEGTIEIVTGAIPPAAKGKKYSITFRARGGVVPYHWEMVTGHPPEGLQFDPERGMISGTPEKWETASFLLRVTGREGRSAEKKFKLEVTAAIQTITGLRIVTDSLPKAVRGELYNADLTAADGALPYTWTISQGELPPSLTLDSDTGIIAGIPEQAGKAVFHILVSDKTGNTATRELELTVDYQLVYITTGTLSIAVVGNNYQQEISATGGTPPYTFTLESGEMPANLTLDSASGQILGTISENYFGQGTLDFIFRIKAVDQTGNYDIVELKMIVRETAEPTPPFSPTPLPLSSPTPVPTISPIGLHISTSSLPDGFLGENYNQTIAALGGVKPYVWSISESDLPPGLSGSSSGKISGVPEIADDYPLDISVTDADDTIASNTLILTIKESRIEGVSGLIGAPGDGKVGLAWTNPAGSDFDEIKVLRKTGGYPRDAGDGTMVYRGAGDNIIDNDLTNNNAYFYAVIVFNQEGTAGEVGDNNRIVITPEEVTLSGENDPYADEVISFTPLSQGGTGSSSMPDIVLGSPRGEGKDKGSLDVVSLHARISDGTITGGGSIILRFTGNLVWNGAGDDFTIFENVFDIMGEESKRWMEPAIVAVSQDGISYYTFPYDYVPHLDDNGDPDCFNPYSYMDGDGTVRGFAGIHPVFSNNGTPDPTNPSVSGGDSFDLSDITRKDLLWIQYIKITATGDGWLTDSNGDKVRHTQFMGACSGAGSSGFDLDAISAVNY
ncbi:MAG: putative Ig domain-containing protein [Candidatus Auribacterota bacterium]|nr:putative Ig domain-containing protein [Candidatus Auribacterota bacterium]